MAPIYAVLNLIEYMKRSLEARRVKLLCLECILPKMHRGEEEFQRPPESEDTILRTRPYWDEGDRRPKD